jgi:uncharacterized protein (TIGR00266 family)
MTDQVDYTIVGDDFQAVEITLDPGESVRAEPGAFMWMEEGIEMSTGTGGGLMAGLKRKISGESFFITTFTNGSSERRRVSFAASYPGKIIAADLSQKAILCQRNAYLCSAQGIDISLAFTRRLGAGLLGGEGFILQRLQGDGLAFIHAGGHIIEHELAANQSLRVDTGCLVAFEAGVDYDIQRIKGVTSMLFGGEGLFYAIVRGPGKVWVQTTPLSRFAARILMAGKRGKKGEVRRGGMGMLGRLIGGD